MARLTISNLPVSTPREEDWLDLSRLPEAELERRDVADSNLRCAAGLPESEKIDHAFCLRRLDDCATIVKRSTDAAYPQYFLPDPGHYQHSEAFFRAVSLVITLQRHGGIRYDPKKIGARPNEAFDFEEQFVHGVLQSGKGGTCATIPVVYAAVGRRLGYPIKLVHAVNHMFARWDDSKTGERFNIEGAGEGFDSFPDDHYRNWPAPIRNLEDERRFGFLKSLSPREELADFVAQRAWVLKDRGFFQDAAHAFAVASDLDLQHAQYSQCLLECLRDWKSNLQARLMPKFPQFRVVAKPEERRWPTSVPWEVEREFAALLGLQQTLDNPEAEKRWWKPLREGKLTDGLALTTVTIHYCSVQTKFSGRAA